MLQDSYSNLEEKLKVLLQENCTGMDDHDEIECRKCSVMLHAIMVLVIQWNNGGWNAQAKTKSKS